MDNNRTGIDLGLNDDEKAALLELARSTIEKHLSGEELPECPLKSEKLNEHRGAFVTLHKKTSLRGCIGFIHASKPLRDTIRDMAIAAAFQDPRFDPVTAGELDELSVEISVLTPFQEIDDIDEIQVGKHGLMIVSGQQSGLLLPQVAVQYGWDRETFLEHTCMKAGLPPDAWRNQQARIVIFSADVF